MSARKITFVVEDTSEQSRSALKANLVTILEGEGFQVISDDGDQVALRYPKESVSLTAVEERRFFQREGAEQEDESDPEWYTLEFDVSQNPLWQSLWGAQQSDLMSGVTMTFNEPYLEMSHESDLVERIIERVQREFGLQRIGDASQQPMQRSGVGGRLHLTDEEKVERLVKALEAEYYRESYQENQGIHMRWKDLAPMVLMPGETEESQVTLLYNARECLKRLRKHDPKGLLAEATTVWNKRQKQINAPKKKRKRKRT